MLAHTQNDQRSQPTCWHTRNMVKVGHVGTYSNMVRGHVGTHAIWSKLVMLAHTQYGQRSCWHTRNMVKVGHVGTHVNMVKGHGDTHAIWPKVTAIMLAHTQYIRRLEPEKFSTNHIFVLVFAVCKDLQFVQVIMKADTQSC